MIKTQSPTRVDLAGGTLDCWPLYLFVGDCMTVNLSIDVLTGCELTENTSPEIIVEMSDLKFKKSYKNLGDFLASVEPEVLLVQKVLDYYKPANGLTIKTFSQSPIGGGLGGSSSLTISIMKAFNQLLKRDIDLNSLVRLASNIEAKVIKSPTGTQDYFPAIQPGLNVIHYTPEGARLERIENDHEVLNRHLMLFYTGKSHHSGINNWQVIKSVIEGDINTLSALKEIAAISLETAQACRQGQWQELPQLFRREFDSRVKLTPSFTSPEIERFKKLVFHEGGDAVKICGAGGGGCVLVWADPRKQKGIIETCQKNGFHHIPFRSVKNQIAP